MLKTWNQWCIENWNAPSCCVGLEPDSIPLIRCLSAIPLHPPWVPTPSSLRNINAPTSVTCCHFSLKPKSQKQRGEGNPPAFFFFINGSFRKTCSPFSYPQSLSTLPLSHYRWKQKNYIILLLTKLKWSLNTWGGSKAGDDTPPSLSLCKGVVRAIWHLRTNQSDYYSLPTLCS